MAFVMALHSCGSGADCPRRRRAHHRTAHRHPASVDRRVVAGRTPRACSVGARRRREHTTSLMPSISGAVAAAPRELTCRRHSVERLRSGARTASALTFATNGDLWQVPIDGSARVRRSGRRRAEETSIVLRPTDRASRSSEAAATSSCARSPTARRRRGDPQRHGTSAA